MMRLESLLLSLMVHSGFENTRLSFRFSSAIYTPSSTTDFLNSSGYFGILSLDSLMMESLAPQSATASHLLGQLQLVPPRPENLHHISRTAF